MEIFKVNHVNSKDNLYTISEKHMHKNKVLLTKLRHTKEARKACKQGWAIQEECKEIVQGRRDGVKKAKAHLPFSLM